MQTFHDSAYSLYGDPSRQPLVVLVHGVGLWHGMWRQYVDPLSRHFSVLTYDLLGHGESANPPGERTVRDFVDQLSGLVDHLGVDRFTLAGFSLGALIAQGFASLHHPRLSRLALLHGVYRRSEEQCQAVRERVRITREEGPMVTLGINLERWFSGPYRQAHPEVMAQIREQFAGHVDDGYLKAYHLFAHAETEMGGYPLHEVSCPSLVLTGSADTGSTPEMSRAMSRDLPAATLVVNDGHRHMAPMEHADVVIGQLLEFCGHQGR